MAAESREQARILRELADRIERADHVLPEELVAQLCAAATRTARSARVGAAIERALRAHHAILAKLAK